MKKNLAILLLLITCFAWKQEEVWKQHTIYDLSVLLPPNATRTDTTFTKDGITADATILSSESLDYSFTVTAIGGMDKSTDSDQKLLEDVGIGFCKGLRSYPVRCLISDTTIDNLATKKGSLSGDRSVVSYMVILNDKLYNLTLALPDDVRRQGLFTQFMSGVDFNNAAKRIRKGWTTESKPEIIGKLAGYAVIAALVIWLLVRATRKNRDKTQTNS